MWLGGVGGRGQGRMADELRWNGCELRSAAACGHGACIWESSAVNSVKSMGMWDSLRGRMWMHTVNMGCCRRRFFCVTPKHEAHDCCNRVGRHAHLCCSWAYFEPHLWDAIRLLALDEELQVHAGRAAANRLRHASRESCWR